ELADHSNFEEVAFLILNGELPSPDQLAAFRKRVYYAMRLPDAISGTLAAIPATANFMDVMRTGASMLAHWDDDVAAGDHDANLRKSERLLAQLPMVMAVRHRHLMGMPPVTPREDLSLAGNILWMLRGSEPAEIDVKAMDVSLILYAEHEFNASTFTSRVVASTLSDLHSGITAAIGALKGPLHGGANERVLDVLQQVGTPENAAKWVNDALVNKVKIMGFGHRVYKTGDPRAKYLVSLCQKLATRPEYQQMEATAKVIEDVIVREKGLPPNLDWPSARLYYYMGLPVELYTPLFVVSRVVGWSAHVIEQLENNRIIRPRSRYTGPAARAYPKEC
ncbi:MAG: citrate synthase, partial [Planctomycetales bacterium]|nr:citrate synthase [Planctomycetales bacterium]